MAHADLTQADHDLLVRIARENALKAVAAAKDAMLRYSDHLDGDQATRILDAYDLLGEAQRRAEDVAG